LFFKRKLQQEELPYEIGSEISLLNENKINNFVKAKVVDRKLQIFYEVDFGDGTYSSDMMPEDIEAKKKIFFLKNSHYDF
jgi:hypothetical protein